MVGSQLGFMFCTLTARVQKRAVSFGEITFYQLKAGMKSGSHLRLSGDLRLPGCERGQSRSVKSSFIN